MRAKSQLRSLEYYLSPNEIRKVIYAAKSFRDRCLIKTLAQTWMRRAEVASLHIRGIDFERNLIHIRQGKGGKSQTIPITDGLSSDLRHLIGSRKTGVLFESNKAGPSSLRQINWIVASAGERSGVKNPNPGHSKTSCHLLRRSFAREWKKRGGSIESLSKILGRTSIKTTLDEYRTVDLKGIRENFKKLMQNIF